MQNTSINSYSELRELFTRFNESYIYRGQSNSSWEINSTLLRNEFIPDKIIAEKKMIHQLDKTIHLYENSNRIPKGKIEKLAYLQHHGAPTRLIDFTYSPYVAAYFAMKDCKTEGSVFAINFSYLREVTINFLKRKMSHELAQLNKLISPPFTAHEVQMMMEIAGSIETKYMIGSVFSKKLKKGAKHKQIADIVLLYQYYFDMQHFFLNKKRGRNIGRNIDDFQDDEPSDYPYGEEPKDKDYDYKFLFEHQVSLATIIKLEPFYQNQRMIPQSGCFLTQTDISKSFIQIINSLGRTKYPILNKLNISVKLRREILNDLEKMNISEESLFPDLDGFIRSLGLKCEN